MVIEAVRSGDPAVVTDPVMSLSGDLEEMGHVQSISLLDILTDRGFGLIRVKKEGWTGFAKGWQGYSQGADLPARGKPGPSLIFYSD